MDEVSFIDGKTPLFGIVGDPIVQVKSPEIATYEMQKRGLPAILILLRMRKLILKKPCQRFCVCKI